ncbi:MAG: hypothetical protein JJU06_17860 [Ectothiorhodospiraceae bacterium]|nr:hypothetical protein [Ectothiorhodospiraceae bacterium]
MMEWLDEYAQVIELGIGLATLFVWVFYAQLLLSGYLRQRRPKVLVNQGVGTGVGSRCLISNMSQEAIHLETIFGTLETERGRFTTTITDHEPPDEDDKPVDIPDGTSQGPVKSGEYLDMGDFLSVINRVGRDRRLPTTKDGSLDRSRLKVSGLEITVVALYGPEDKPIAACRSFSLVGGEDAIRLKPEQIGTRQLRSGRQRRKVLGWVKDSL